MLFTRMFMFENERVLWAYLRELQYFNGHFLGIVSSSEKDCSTSKQEWYIFKMMFKNGQGNIMFGRYISHQIMYN